MFNTSRFPSPGENSTADAVRAVLTAFDDAKQVLHLLVLSPSAATIAVAREIALCMRYMPPSSDADLDTVLGWMSIYAGSVEYAAITAPIYTFDPADLTRDDVVRIKIIVVTLLREILQSPTCMHVACHTRGRNAMLRAEFWISQMSQYCGLINRYDTTFNRCLVRKEGTTEPETAEEAANTWILIWNLIPGSAW